MSGWLEIFLRFWPDLLQGAGMTLLLTAEGLAAGFVLGLLAALGRAYGGKVWRALAVGYIELFRGTPLLMQVFLLYYGLPGLGITLSREWAAFLALGLNSGAIRPNTCAVPSWQSAKGRCWPGAPSASPNGGRSGASSLPRGAAAGDPAWAGEPVSLLKSTAVVFLIAVPELMAKAKSNRRQDV